MLPPAEIHIFPPESEHFTLPKTGIHAEHNGRAKVSKRSLPKLVRKYAEIPSRQMAEEFPRR